MEDKLGGGPPDAKQSLRLWLKLLTCAGAIERRVAGRFRDDFDSTLPRFDFLSALDRAGAEGVTMGEVSRMLRVTNGNVTGLAQRLKADGLVETMDGPDRRVQRVRLTPLGRSRFAAMAQAHAGWIESTFSGLDEQETADLLRLLDRAKQSITRELP